ncbi:MAG TPA: hypothetical protein ENJ08_04375 [Gammaproteobacteria bacterium]|nr:hypothetical protein [Gammaproteobacteria bacterium]
MNITNKLNELQQEILNFGDVVNQTQNLSDMDFRNACDLFSQHLNFELDSISSNVCLIKDNRSEVHQTTAQLHQLNELITPATSDINTNQWSDNLNNFCSQLQALRCIAA